jgi:excisionase family DNA binding protein
MKNKILSTEFEHYSVKDLAKLLKVSERTIYNSIHTGELKGMKLAEKWRFSKEDVNRFLKIRQTVEYPVFIKGVYKKYKDK